MTLLSFLWLTTTAFAGDRYVFDWSAPCTVPVQDTVQKDGRSSVTRYDVRLVPFEDTQLAVYLEHFQPLENDGQPLSAKAQRLFRKRMKQVGALPPYFVGRDGTFVGLPTDDAFLDRMFASLSVKAHEAEETRALLTDQAAVNLMMADAARMWWAWVGAWVGHDLPDDASVVAPTTYVGADGIAHSVATTFTRLDVRSGAALQADMEIPIELLGVDTLVDKLRELLHHEPTGDELPRRVLSATITWDMSTGRPFHTLFTVSDRLVPGTPEQVTTRSMFWLWDDAVGCGAPTR